MKIYGIRNFSPRFSEAMKGAIILLMSMLFLTKSQDTVICPTEPAWTNTVVLRTTGGDFYELSYLADIESQELTIKVTVEGASWIGMFGAFSFD